MHSLFLWVEERAALQPLLDAARKKDVPVHRHTVWYYFGGMTVFLFAIQAVTGVLLLFYYRPSAEGAFESVQFIMAEVEFGWLVRSLHSWAANVLIATLFIHMASVFFMKAYRPPRELTWFSGVFLLFVALGFGFSGYLLPWNTLAFFATTVGTEVAGVVPWVGGFAVRLLRGGEDVTGATLTRFFAIHVAVLPAATIAGLAWHLWLVQHHGMSVPPSVDESKLVRMKFVPDFLLRDAMGWLAALGVLAALAAIFPWELGEKADRFAPAPAGIRPEWFFVFMFQTLKLLPGRILFWEGEAVGVVAFAMAAVLLMVVPVIDARLRPPGRSWLLDAAGILVLLYVAAMTVLGYLT